MTEEKLIALIDRERRIKNYSKNQLSKCSGVSRPTVIGFLRRQHSIGVNGLLKILDALGLEIRLVRKEKIDG